MRYFYILLTLLFAKVALAEEDKPSRNLGDIKLEIEFLSAQMDGLRNELLETGAALSQTNSGDPVSRVNAIEHELRLLTGQVEELEHRIDLTTKKMEARIQSIEAQLDTAEQVGGISFGDEDTDTISDIPSGVDLTIAEREDFEVAKLAFEDGEFREAEEKFADFNRTYPGGPMTSVAHLYRGKALYELEDWKQAGISFLESFSTGPKAPRAAEALYSLGESFVKLDNQARACGSLIEVPNRFPQSPYAEKAKTLAAELGCSS